MGGHSQKPAAEASIGGHAAPHASAAPTPDDHQAHDPAPASYAGASTVPASPEAASLAFGHLADGAAPRLPTLDETVRAARHAVMLGGVVRSAFAPGFRNAVDAVDPMAAMELARNVAGSLQVIDDARTKAASAMRNPSQWRQCRPGEPSPDVGAIEGHIAELMTLSAELNADTTLASDIAAQVGPQVFQGQAVMGAGPPKLGKNATGYIISQASVVVELLFVVQQARAISGGRKPGSASLTPDQQAQIVALVEPWRTRPVNFGFLTRALGSVGLLDPIKTAKGPSGRTLEETEAATIEQAKETGAYADVGALDIETMERLFAETEDEYDPDDGGFTPGRTFDDDSAIEVVRALQTAAPDARGALIRQMKERGHLSKLGEHLPPAYVEQLADSIRASDGVAANQLDDYAEAPGGESVQRRLLNNADENIAEGDVLGGYGWFFLNFLHNALTFGFAGEYGDAYDAHAQGFTTDDQFSSAATRALGKAAVVGAASAVTGGLAGEFAAGAAAGLRAGTSVQTLIAGGVGGFASGVGGHFAGDVYDQALNGKDGFDSFSSYMRSGAEGGAMGTFLAGVSLASGKYLPASAQRMTDIYAAKYPSLGRVLESVRETGFSSGRSVRMSVGELLDMLGSGFGGPGGPTAFSYAGIGDVRALPLDTQVAVRMRPKQSISEPMQMSTPKGPDGPDGSAPIPGDAVEPSASTANADGPAVAIESVEPVSKGPEADGPATGKNLSEAEWREHVRRLVGDEGMDAYEQIRGKRTDADVQKQFDGDFSRVEAAIAKRLGKAATTVDSKAQLQKKIQDAKLMEDPLVRDIIERLGPTPSQAQLENARSTITDHVMGELNARQLEAKYPGTRVLRNVRISKRLAKMSREQYRATGASVDGVRELIVDGETYVYRDVSDVDAMVVAAGGDGKLKIVHREEVKLGTDSPTTAQDQLDAGRTAIANAADGGTDIRLDVNGVDMTEAIDLASVRESTEATRGTANRGFKESVGITQKDLRSLMDELLQQARSAAKPGVAP